MSFDQIPVDVAGEQLIDMSISGATPRAMEGDFGPSAHSGHQLDSEKIAQAEDRLILTVGVGMECIRLNLGAVLQEAVEDIDRFSDAARNKCGEERDIGVGDMVIGDAAIATVSDVA